jgi:hypothetical protein
VPTFLIHVIAVTLDPHVLIVYLLFGFFARRLVGAVAGAVVWDVAIEGWMSREILSRGAHLGLDGASAEPARFARRHRPVAALSGRRPCVRAWSCRHDRRPDDRQGDRGSRLRPASIDVSAFRAARFA